MMIIENRCMPNLPTSIVPTNIAWVKLSRRVLRKSLWTWEFHILLRERNPLLFYSERGILYYSTPREESFTILLRERNPLLFYSERPFQIKIVLESSPRRSTMLVGGLGVTCIYLYIHVCIIDIYIYIYIHIHTCMYTYIYIYIQRERERWAYAQSTY